MRKLGWGAAIVKVSCSFIELTGAGLVMHTLAVLLMW